MHKPQTTNHKPISKRPSSISKLGIKSIFSFLLIAAIIISPLNLISQTDGICSGVDFDLSGDGFICDGGDGEICLTYYPEFFDPDCEDQGYVWRVSYPTDEFVIIDTGDFNFGQGTNNTITILENDNYLVATDIPSVTLCFEGNIIDPGVEFIFTYESADGTDVIETQSIIPDAFTTITGNVTVSSAIAAMNLLPTNQSATTRQTVVIDGTLIVDIDYTFSNQSKILMNNSSSGIIVNSGVDFNLEFSEVSGCNSTWDEITLESGSTMRFNNSTIKDANIGINSLPGSELISLRFIIEDCHRGVKANNSLFTYGGNNFSISRIFNCDLGIDLDNMTNTTNIAGLFILDCNRGIECNNASLVLSGSTMENLSQHGLFINGGTSIVRVIGSNFAFCPFGIRAPDVEDLYVEGNSSFFGNFIDIFRFGLPNDFMEVDNCTFDGCRSTNIHSTMFSGVAKIQNSKLGALDGIGNNTNVLGFGIGGGDHDITVQLNPTVVATRQNIQFNNLINPSVSRNGIIWSQNSSSIFVKGGDDPNITYNSNIVAEISGVNIISSPNSKVNCNTINSQTDLIFDGNCAESRVHANTFGSSQTNLRYSTGASGDIHTGIQFREGNMFNNGGDGMVRAVHEGDDFQAAMDQYLVNAEGLGQASTFFPLFISDFDKWFDETFASNLECVFPPGFNDPIGPKDEKKSMGIVSNISHIARLSSDGIDDEIDYNAGLVLYRSLYELAEDCGSLCTQDILDYIISSQEISPTDLIQLFPSVLTEAEGTAMFSFDIEEWYNSNADNYQDVIAFEEAYKSALKMEESEVLDLENLRSEFRNKSDELIAAYNEMEIIGDNAYTTDLKSDINSVATAISVIRAANDTKISNAISNLRNINDGIDVPDYLSDDYIKNINKLTLDIIEFGSENELRAGDKNWLLYISEACIDEVGKSKFAAQSLLNFYDYTMTEFSTSCDDEPEGYSSNNSNTISKLSIYPNPAVDMISLKLDSADDKEEEQVISIFDVYGQEIYTGKVNNQEELKLYTSTWPQGIYYIKDKQSQILNKLLIIE